MDGYKLRKIDATVGMFADFTSFKDVLNDMVKIDPRLGIDDVQDLTDALSENGGDFEDSAKSLCMDALDGVDEDDDAPEAEWGDGMYDRAAGK